MPINQTRIFIHLRWTLVPPGDVPTDKYLVPLVPYLTRYASTLGVKIAAIGGGEDDLHVLLELPSDSTLTGLEGELRAAAKRFAADFLGSDSSAWLPDGFSADSVSFEEFDELRVYISDNAARHASGSTVPRWEGPTADSVGGDEDTPQWLRDAMARATMYNEP